MNRSICSTIQPKTAALELYPLRDPDPEGQQFDLQSEGLESPMEGWMLSCEDAD